MTTPLPDFFLPLTSPHATLERVGGKGANLARLARAGFNVPIGFFITTRSYRQFVNENHLDKSINAALADLTSEDPAGLETASQCIRAAFEQAPVSQALRDALHIAYQWIGAPPVAVRSSATAEDLPDLSFAGQQDTFLNVLGAVALVQAVVECWSSLWTARAIGYRTRNDIPQEDVSLAVVVQEMVQSEVSGVMFTANPLSGKRDEIVIDATFGLGEALVSGQVEPDNYVLSLRESETTEVISPANEETASPADRNTPLKIKSKTLGAKATVIRGQAQGGLTTESGDHAQQQALPDKAILALAEIGKRIAEQYDFPQDIEWAYVTANETKLPPTPQKIATPPAAARNDTQGNLYLLQSRPITSLYPLPEGLPTTPLTTLVGFHVVQGIHEPLTPLGLQTMQHVLAGGARVFGAEYTYKTQTAFLPAGERLWIDFTPLIRHPLGHKIFPGAIKSIDPAVAQIYQSLLDHPDLAPVGHAISPRSFGRVLRFLLPFWGRILSYWRLPEKSIQRLFDLMDEEVVKTKARSEPTGEMWQDFRNTLSIWDEASKIFPDLVVPVGVSAVVAGMIPFFGILQRFSKQTDNPNLYLEIARGLPHNVTTEMDLALWETARTIQQDAAATDDFSASSAPELAHRYLNEDLLPSTQQAIAAFMTRYGMRGLGEIDIGRPRWREDPTHIMQVLQSYLNIRGAEKAPDAVFARGAVAAQLAADRLIADVCRLPGGWFKSRLVRWAVRRYRALAGLREAPKFFAIRMLGITRQRLLEIGAGLVQAGALAAPDDLFFLLRDELESIIVQKSIPPELQNAISKRRETRAREMRRKQLPRVLLSDGTAYYEGMVAPPGDQNAIIGDPVSPGVVEGIVNVVFDPRSAQLQPGEILVCPGTDPAWTPLFLAAGGLVMEVGGMMTHGSVVAREYGIPAVVGVHEATRRLKSGQRIRVDGSGGAITVLDSET